MISGNNYLSTLPYQFYTGICIRLMIIKFRGVAGNITKAKNGITAIGINGFEDFLKSIKIFVHIRDDCNSHFVKMNENKGISFCGSLK